MRDPILTTRRELAIRYATRGTTLQLARAVTVLEVTGGVDYDAICRHQITTLILGGTMCCCCGVILRGAQ